MIGDTGGNGDKRAAPSSPDRAPGGHGMAMDAGRPGQEPLAGAENSRTVSGMFGASRTVIALYVLLITYASLYPLSGWRPAVTPFWSFMRWPPEGELSRADMFSNVLAYIPLGLLLAMHWRSKGRMGWTGVLCATLGGAFLSLAMETLQQYLPTRTPSAVDLLTNSLGTWMGAVSCHWAHGEANFAARLRGMRERWCVDNPVANGGLLALAVWALSQLSPFVPWFDSRAVRRTLRGIWLAVEQPARFDLALAAVYGTSLLGLGLLAVTLMRPGRRVLPLFAIAASGTLFLKMFIVGRTLSPEALAGLCAALALLQALRGLAARHAAWAALAAIAGAFALSELIPLRGFTHPFNWIPFAGEIRSNVDGFATILGGVWPFVAIGYLANALAPVVWRSRTRMSGALLVLLITGSLEWAQTWIPGRHGDITTILLALAGWLIAWHWAERGPARG
jgi:VanZ family protein